MKVISGKSGTISYRYIFKSSERLIVILPRASADFESHKRLIWRLGETASVVFVEEGYYGLGPAAPGYDMVSFNSELHKLLEKLKHQHVVFVAESVGAMHALYYGMNFNNQMDFALLSNPALYKPKKIDDTLFIPILKFSIRFMPDLFLAGITKALKLTRKTDLLEIAEAFDRMQRTVGAKSYLMCLLEISDFGKNTYHKEPHAAVEKTGVLKGGKDGVFRALCNEDYFSGSKYFEEISDVGHSLIDDRVEDVVRILRKVVSL
jgi:pimeloyl-ACP methyl ester carboxylesterase